MEVISVPIDWRVEARSHPRFERPLESSVRQASLLNSAPWVRSVGKLPMDVSSQGWRFPLPPDQPLQAPPKPTPTGEAVTKEGLLPLSALPAQACVDLPAIAATPTGTSAGPSGQVCESAANSATPTEPTRVRPPRDAVGFKDRLLYLLQPPLEAVFGKGQISLPFKPFPYQVKGIAFLMPRHHALIADEMGLGKTVQVIVALRLLFHAGLIRNTLVVCPKPLVINWSRELRLWAPDLPFEVLGGDVEQRRYLWHTSTCPLKLVNYELLGRDEAFVLDEK